MSEVYTEMEITAAAREDETLAESVRNDPSHSTERVKLVLSVGTIPEVRKIVEPLLLERSKIKARIKHIQRQMKDYPSN